MTEHHRTAAWGKTRNTNRPRIAATLPAPCVDCPRLVTRDQVWQVGHIVSVAQAKAQGWTTQQINHPSNLGPSHRSCNASAGGKLGAAKTNAERRTRERKPNW